jgi:hypothetical protein
MSVMKALRDKGLSVWTVRSIHEYAGDKYRATPSATIMKDFFACDGAWDIMENTTSGPIHTHRLAMNPGRVMLDFTGIAALNDTRIRQDHEQFLLVGIPFKVIVKAQCNFEHINGPWLFMEVFRVCPAQTRGIAWMQFYRFLRNIIKDIIKDMTDHRALLQQDMTDDALDDSSELLGQTELANTRSIVCVGLTKLELYYTPA